MKKSILFLIPFLALGMAACQRNNGKPSSSGGGTGSNPSSSGSGGGGGGGGGDTHKGSLAPYGVGYEVKAGDYYFQLIEDTSVEDEDHVGCWKNADVQVDADTQLQFFNNGAPVQYFAVNESVTNKNNIKEAPGSSDPFTTTTIYNSVETTTITLNKWASGDYTFWLDGFASKGTVNVNVDIVYETWEGKAVYFASSWNSNTLDTTTRLTYQEGNHQIGQFTLDIDKQIYCQFVRADYQDPTPDNAEWNYAIKGFINVTSSTTSITNSDFPS